MKDDTPIPPQKCPHCGYSMDTTAAAFGTATPKKNDISVCLACGKLGLFNEDLTIRVPTPEESLKISLLPEVIQVQMARIHVVGDKIKNRKDK